MELKDYIFHVHTAFTGHEFTSLECIRDYIEETGRYVVVTNHFHLNELGSSNSLDGKEFRREWLNKLRTMDKVIVGGEFTLQLFNEFISNKKGKDFIRSLDCVILSLHGVYGYTDYTYKEDGSIDIEGTNNLRKSVGSIKVKRYSMDRLLRMFRRAVSSYKGVKVLGHIDRFLNDCLLEGNTCKDREEFRDKILDICKEYGVIVEINIGEDNRNSNKKLITLYNKAIDKGLKIVIGHDVHYDKDLLKTKEVGYTNETLEVIESEYVVNISDLLGNTGIGGLVQSTKYLWDYYKCNKSKGISLNRYLVMMSSEIGKSLEECKYILFNELLDLGKRYNIPYNKIYNYVGIDYQVVYQYVRSMRSRGIDLYDKFMDKGKQSSITLLDKNKERYNEFNKVIEYLVDNKTLSVKEAATKFGVNENILRTYMSRNLYNVDSELYGRYKQRKVQ